MINSKEEREVITIKTHVTSFKDDSFNDSSIFTGWKLRRCSRRESGEQTGVNFVAT